MFGFEKKPTFQEATTFNSDYASFRDLCSAIPKADDVDVFVTQRKNLMENLSRMIAFQKKYPKMFKGKDSPQKIAEQMKKDRKQFEKAFVDRYIKATMRNIIEYKTDRGREDCFTHAVEVFAFYHDEFLPETMKYFQKLIKNVPVQKGNIL